MPKIANRIVIAVLAVLVIAGGGLVTTSAAGVLSPPTATLDPGSYVLPPPTPEPAEPGLEVPDASRTADSAWIQQALDGLDRRGLGTVSYCVTDLSGNQVAAEDGDTARIPASSWKLVTSMAVLSAYGPNQRFTTTVVSSSTGIVLVGAGDPFLTKAPPLTEGQAQIQDLANQTVTALSNAGSTTVTLGYDDSLFAGPQWNPAWPTRFAADVAPISALSVDPNGSADSNTSADAAQYFKGLLAAQGISVTSVQPEHADAGATVLASVDSLPLGQIVARVLSNSDNFGAEVLARHAAVAAGGDGSYGSVQSALTAYLQSHNLWTSGMSVSDGSGLSNTNLIPPSVFAKAVRTMYADPDLVDILVGMPVAGVDGTLSRRFDDPDEANGRGVVHAKTGTLDIGVRTLTGFAQSSTGAVMVFSFMLNGLSSDAAGVNWLDEAGAVLAS